MSAAVDHYAVEQGATVRRVYECLDDDENPVDLTGCSAAMDVRTEPSASTPLLQLASPANITVGTTDGRVTVTFTAAQSASLPVQVLSYDLELTHPDASVTKLARGLLTVIAEVTR